MYMDWQKYKVSAEIYGLKARAKIALVLNLIGVGLVLLGAYNFLAAPALDMAVFAPYGRFGLIINTKADAAYYLSDILVMGAGGSLVWFL